MQINVTLTGHYCVNLQSDRRVVPEHIPRPDYADHPQGFPLSEQKLKGNTYIRQLDADEIDGGWVRRSQSSVIHSCQVS